ncbi:MAG TPA: choice-of-anchor tandem repeat NxxGxxAF-containing protein [Methylomirabilota bacterium]|jgi:hypothetical protein|nr:choice-of-anchor tandem repeat NxxGxxAF-containing protein [Methylomirabilota bacterium]
MRPWIVLVLASAVILAGRPAGYGQPAITIRPVALVGDTTPSGGTFVKFDDRPNINENGDVLFHASVAGGKAERGIFLASQGTLVKVVAEGDPTPAGGAFETFSIGRPLTTRSRTAIFVGYIKGQRRSEGIFVAARGVIAKIAAIGDPTPIGGTFAGFIGRPTINEDEVVTFGANIDGGSAPWGIFLAARGRLTNVLADGAPAPRGGTLTKPITHPVINAHDEVAFGGTIRGGPAVQGVFLVSRGQLLQLVSEGEAAAGTGGSRFLRFKDVDLNDRGDVPFRAHLVGGAAEEGLFVASRQGVIKVAAGAEPVAPGARFGHPIGRPRATGGGAIFFKAHLQRGRGGAGWDGIYVSSQGTITQIVAEGAATPVGGTFVNLTAPFPNDAGASVFRANVVAGSTSEGIFVAK